MAKLKTKDSEKKNIIILGGGFAGIRTALNLSSLLSERDDYQIILIDKKDYHTYTPSLYEAATTEHGLIEAKRVKKAVTVPLAHVFGKTKVKVFKGYIEGIDLDNGMVVTDSKILNYNYLVVGMGSISDSYGIPGVEKFGFPLKTLDEAIMIRNRVEQIVTTKDSATIVIGGGGYTGAEFAGELYNLIKKECEHHQKDFSKFQIMVVEGGTGYLPGLPENISALLTERLNKMGVVGRFSTLITEAGSNYLVLNNKEKIDCDLLVWTGGVRSCRNPFVSVTVDRDKKDRMLTQDSLNLKKYPNVFVAGDNLCFVDPVTKKPIPQTAYEAIRHGELIAKNIYRMIHFKPLAPYHPRSPLFVVPVSGKYAIFYTKHMFISGRSGWFIRKMIDLQYFMSILPFSKAIRYWLFETELFIKND